MGELANCVQCGTLFVKSYRDICPACKKEEDKKFETVYQFIRKRENRMATLAEVTESTGVEEKLILRFIKEGRLQLSKFPNLGYPCAKCGNTIREGKLCDDCKTSLRNDIMNHSEEQKREEARKLKEKTATYYSVDK
ncbi:TIGR03826 family flagellar region protein [Bacillus marinisedimentorum]|uniref:TIGR03826 family flagellar region protein n=1 Tax=Bacillus marinisedimentorum TaxID=1821260 RepID=UPI0007E0C0ED|nr:TIGR03826 family flagellar region protein [Bacillus marinisedimentorum]